MAVTPLPACHDAPQEKKRSEELQARTKTTDAELRRLAEEVEAQQRELLELRQDAAERLEGRGSRRINEVWLSLGRGSGPPSPPP